MERKIASVQVVAEIKPIEGADAIEAVRINGWWVVSKKGEHKVNDLVVYCEVDSFIPTEVAPFLTKPEYYPKEYNGVKGEKLRTIRLRGQLSQGLVLPISVCDNIDSVLFEGLDVSIPLGIQKWEAPEQAGTNSQAKGNFPHFLCKTDQERAQNLMREIEHDWQGMSFEVTIKVDGSSLTAYVIDGVFGVCSRNIDLKEVEGNAFWDTAKKEDLHSKIYSTGRNLAIQGELTAPNIQNNHNKETKPTFNCFSIFDIDKQSYLLPHERQVLCKDLGIPHVKILHTDFVLTNTVEDLLKFAEGEGDKPGIEREGLVFKSNVSPVSFKVISNKYLLRNS